MVEIRRKGGDIGVVLRSGETILGRGPLLKIDATNVSRKHARLVVNTDTANMVTLTCLHKNPIMVKKGEWRELGQDQLIELGHEDEFKFLENGCHFTVFVPGKEWKQEKERSVSDPDPASQSQVASRKRKLPDWMLDSSSSELKHSPGKTEFLDGRDDSPDSSSSKIKVKSPVMNVSDKFRDSFGPDEDVDAGHTLVTATEMDSEENNKENVQHKVGTSVTSRASCTFGSACYRKNPMHRVEEAHPGDDDYKDPTEDDLGDGVNDDRPECEFGTDCYRKNPEHKKQFKHCHKPAQPQRGAKVIVTKKKKVKVTKKKNEWDEYESGDSFIDDDEEDDWSPVDDSDDDADWTPKLSPENMTRNVI